MQPPVSIPTALVYPNADGRAVIKAHVAALAESLRALGLQTPVTVRRCVRVRDGRDAEAFEIVAGRHRYEAAVALNWKEIDAFIMEGDEDDAELWEIDENFARAELSEAQRADHHVRRERILLAKGIIHARGGDRKSNSQVGGLKSYVEEASRATGAGKSTVARDLARGKKIAPEVLAAVTGTDLDKGVVLDELSRVPRVEQPARLDEIRARKEAHKVNREHDRVIALTEAEQFAEWLLVRTDLNELPTIISWLQGTKPNDVIAALRREAA